MSTVTDPPHDHPDQPAADHLPRGPGAGLFKELMSRASAVLESHPVNRARIAAGKKPANAIWLWGQGRAPACRSSPTSTAWTGRSSRRSTWSAAWASWPAGRGSRSPARPATSTRTTPPRARRPSGPWTISTSSACTSRPRTRRATRARRRQGRGDRAHRSRDRRPVATSLAEVRPLADGHLARSLDPPADPGARPRPGGLGHGGDRPARPRVRALLRRGVGPRPPVALSSIRDTG